MSIAAITSNFVTAVGASAALAPAAPAQVLRAAQRGGHEGGRRHDLLDAMSQVLGTDSEQSKDQAQAVLRFAHALMHDLRSIDADDAPGRGRGPAWGRRDWSDLPQRIDALATATAAPGSATPDVPDLPAQPLTPPASAAARPAAGTETRPAVVQAPPNEPPPQPNPVTATSAALHLMQVPSSRLLEAFAALRRALGDQANQVAPQTTRVDLATTLVRLSGELATGASAALPTGSVLNLTA
jgi:hypothetical protein